MHIIHFRFTLYLFLLPGAFMLNNATGVLSKAKRLDREKTDFYSLLVSATDQGSPALWSITTVNITVRDVNDQKPEIHTQDIFYVQEVYISGFARCLCDYE